jgi:hypothetical protein
MTRLSVARVLAVASILGVVGCGEAPEDTASVSSALSSAFFAVRGYRRGMHPNIEQAVTYRDSLGHIARHLGDPPGPAGSLSTSAVVSSAPWGYTRSDALEAIMYADPSRHIHELALLSNGLLDTDFTAAFGAPAVALESQGVTDIIPYVRSDRRNSIVYRAFTGHVIQITSNFGGQPSWLVQDLTNLSRAGVIVRNGSPFPYVRFDGLNTIVYVANGGHIHELANTSDLTGWIDSDLSIASGDTSNPASSPWGYRRADGYNTVVYVNDVGELRELAEPCGPTGWCTNPLPAASPSPLRPSGFVGNVSGLSNVVYVSNSGSIHALLLYFGTWSDTALPMPPNVTAASEAFGHSPTEDPGKVLFLGRDIVTGDTHACEITQLTFTFPPTWIALTL